MIWAASFGGEKRKKMVWTHLRISSPAVCRQMCSSCTCPWEYAKCMHSSTPVYVDTSWLLKLQIWYQNNPFCAEQVFAKLHTAHLWKSNSESLVVCTSPTEQAAELWPLVDSELIQKLPVTHQPTAITEQVIFSYFRRSQNDSNADSNALITTGAACEFWSVRFC